MRPYLTNHRRNPAPFVKAALLTGAALWLPGLASAQTTAPQATPASAASSTSGTAVPEIIVTATKHDERLQDVPASVTALAGPSLEQSGIVRFEDYAALVPGLSFSSIREGSTQLIIRGITTGVAQSAASTATYIDEAPIGSVNAYAGGTSLTPDLDPAELSQIEVLKGPQGTLYGADALGGLIKFDTLAPDFEHFGGRIAAGGDAVLNGATGFSLRGMINIPIVTDKLALSVSGFSREDPGFISNIIGKTDNNDTRVYGGRVDLAWRPTDHISVDLWAMSQDVRNAGAPDENVDATTLKPVYGDLNMKAYVAQPQLDQFRIYNATVKGDLGPLKLTSSTTYQTITSAGTADATLTPIPGVGNLGNFVTLLSEESNLLFGYPFDPHTGVQDSLISKTDRFSQEVRADSSLFAGKLDYQLGFYFTHEGDLLAIPGFFPFDTVTRAPVTLAPAFTPLEDAAIQSRYTEYSGFANATYHFTDQFDLLAGVRYSTDDQHYYQNYHGYLLFSPPIIFSNTASENSTTWLVSPRFKINDDNMIYARVSTGYRPGGPNAVPASIIGAPTTFQPDTLIQYEAGYKAELLDHSLTIDAAAFYTDWNNIQIQTNATLNGATYNFYVNGGRARSQGGELAIAWIPIHGLTLGFNAAYTDAYLTTPAPAAGGLSGDELPFVPKWTGALTGEYRWPVMDGWDAVVGVAADYTGERISNFQNNTLKSGVPVPAYTTVNLNAGVDHGRWSFSVYAKNIGNERGIVYVAPQTLPPNPIANAAIIQPLTVGAEIAAKF